MMIDLLKPSTSKIAINYSTFSFKKQTIRLNYAKIVKLLGYLNIQEVKKILKEMNFQIDDKKNLLIAPLYRNDLKNNNDLVEEVLKKININNLVESPIDQTGINFDYN